MISFTFDPPVSYMSSYEAVMLAIAIVGAIGGLLEALAIARNADAKNASFGTWALVLAGALLWGYYGLMLGNLVILTGSCVGAFSSIVAIAAIWWYNPPGKGYLPMV